MLAGCGDDVRVSQSPEPDATAPPPSLVTIVSGPASGEEVDLEPTPVEDPEDLQAFVAPMDDGLADDVTAAVRQHEPADGTTIAAAVVAIGCDVPPSASVVEDGDAGYRVVPAKVEDPKMECYVAVASVAIVEIPLNPS